MIRNRIVRSFICIKLNLNDPILIFMSIADIFRFAYSYAYTIHGLNLFKNLSDSWDGTHPAQHDFDTGFTSRLK